MFKRLELARTMSEPTPSADSLGLDDLRRLNRIAERLNRSVDVQSALDGALREVVELMGLKTGWLFLRAPEDSDIWWGRGYKLAAHYNLPPALRTDSEQAWKRGCDCQGLCNQGELDSAYNEVKCSRLAAVSGDREGLRVHASAPLRSADSTLGIMNVAGPSWEAFDERSLELLSNAGAQIGVALERARLYDALHAQRTDELQALLELSRQLLESPDLGALLALISLRTAELGEAEASAILMAGDSENTWTFRESFGWRGDPSERRVICEDVVGHPICQSLSEQTVRTFSVEAETDDDSHEEMNWLTEEGFRTMAILPLTVGEDTVGGLLLARRGESEFSEDTVRFLRLIADHAALAVEKARLHQQALERQQLEEELTVARRIQHSFLPPELPQAPGWNFAARYRAARQIGGDFYDAFQLPDGRLGFVVADVMGKGVPAALFMAMARTTLRSTALSGRDPVSTLVRSNELIRKDTDADRFLSALYMALNPENGQLEIASAGHNPPLLITADGEIEELRIQGRILGAFEEIPLEACRFQLNEGDALVAYTDGITESQNPELDFFGRDRLRAALNATLPLKADQGVESVMAALTTFQDGEPNSDDVTLLVLQRENHVLANGAPDASEIVR